MAGVGRTFIFSACLASAGFFGVSGFAGVMDDGEPSFPISLDVFVENVQLESQFPVLSLGNGLKTRDALINFRQDLERYRANNLEGLSRQITAICVQLKRYEAHLNERARENTIGRTEYLKELSRIADERKNCDTRYYHSSPYWKLYDRILERYKKSDREAESQLNSCMSQNACRQRKISYSETE